jgi:predicted nucleotidyltransferase
MLYQAIIKTLVYADMFDYPLTQEEIWKRLIKLKIKNVTTSAGSRNGGKKLKMILKKTKLMEEKNKYYFLRGREKLSNIRIKREKWSEKKQKIAKEVASLLKLIPTIKLVGITGALAVNNAEENDDIDLFIITSSKLLWTTRFLATILAELTGKRRHPRDISVNNKICLNMFVDEGHLSIPAKEQDLFSAHEVAQMKPIWEKNGIYQKFLRANLWVKEYLPNATEEDIKILRYEDIKKKSLSILISKYLSLLENIFRKIQIRYMQKRRTTEIIRDGIIRFHPQDARKWVLREYKKRLEKYRIA